MAYLDVGLNVRYNFRFKNATETPSGGHFENFEIFEIHFDIRYGKNIALRQIVPSIFMLKWNCHTFRDTSRSFQPIVTKLGPYL